VYQPFNFVAGADRHGRFGDHHREARQDSGHLARRRMHVTQIGAAVAAPRRRADRDENGTGSQNA
jgi:hypothetical protein